MTGKRKDNKGRILKKGEGQRPNGTYYYKYKDFHDKYIYVYAKTLDLLRQKEAEIDRDISDGVDRTLGNLTVVELIDKYLSMKRKLKPRTEEAYQSAVSRIRKDPFGDRCIRDIKMSDAKAWFVQLHDSGLKRGTIYNIKTIVKPAFELAMDDDLIRKNPFSFILSDLLPDDRLKRPALTKEQQKRYLKFIEHNGNGNFLDDIIILLETGLRVSELYGLTFKDVDLQNRRIYVKQQLYKTKSGEYRVSTPKSESGIRTVPLSFEACSAISRVIRNRPKPKIELLIGNSTGFLFLDRFSRPKTAHHLEAYMRMMNKKYTQMFGNNMPKVTPHVLRHTFCTNLYQAGIDPKSLQYIMGHSTFDITLSLYTHSNDYDYIEKSFRKVSDSM